jgi:hypothetical protein
VADAGARHRGIAAMPAEVALQSNRLLADRTVGAAGANSGKPRRSAMRRRT